MSWHARLWMAYLEDGNGRGGAPGHHEASDEGAEHVGLEPRHVLD